METKIVIFLAFTSFTLIFNSLVIWFAYKALSNVTTTVTETLQDIERSDEVRSFLEILQTASEQAVSATETAKQKLIELEPVLAEAQSHYGFRLAQVEVRCERTFSRIQHDVARIHNAVIRPADRIGATLAGVLGVLGYLSAEQNDADASPRLKR